MRTVSRRPSAPLGLLLVLSLGIRVAALTGKYLPEHDETVSYIAAAGHQGDYARTVQQRIEPYGRWTTAAAWKNFVKPDRFFDFDRISRDLIATDLHPPLYFWLLHLGVVAAGATLYTGLVLNLILVVLTFFALRGLARQILDAHQTAWALVFWCSSPAVWAISLEARPYDLLAGISVLFIWQTIVFLQHDAIRFRRLALLGLNVIAGALTHYHFLLIMSGGMILAARRWRGDHRRTAIQYLLVVIAAGGISFALHPGLFAAMQRQHHEVMTLSCAQLSRNGDRVLLALTSFVSQVHFIQYTAAALAVAAAILQWRKRLGDGRTDGASRAFADMRFLTLWLTGSTILLFLAGFSPAHAMSAKYLSAIWPLLAVLLARQTGAGRRAWLPGLVLLSMAISSAIVLYGSLQSGRDDDPRILFADGDVVIDTTARGELLRLLWSAPEDLPVLAAMQGDLLANGCWTSRLSCRTMLISQLTYGNTRAGQDRLLRKWPAACFPRPIRPVKHFPGQLFRPE